MFHLSVYGSILIRVSSCSRELTVLPNKNSSANLFLYIPPLVKLSPVARPMPHTVSLPESHMGTHRARGQTGAVHFLGTGRHEHTSSIYNFLLERTVFFKWGWKDKTSGRKKKKVTCWEVSPSSKVYSCCVPAGREKLWTAKVMCEGLCGRKEKKTIK